MTGPYPRGFPEELGRLGLACLERYEAEGDDAALAAGLARLEEAIATAPDHPDRTRWWYGLGSAYECRAVERGCVEDYDRAIEWYDRLHAELAPEDPDRTFIALTLTGACWSRYWLRRYSSAEEPEDCAALVDGLLACVARWPVGEVDGEAAGYVRMIQGLAHQERYGVGGDPADLDRAILLLAGALPGLPDDTPWIAVATLTLATAYRDRYAATNDPRTLDLAIQTAQRTIVLSGAEPGTRLSAYEYQALCYTERWGLAGERADLDRAIESLRVVLADEDDGWAATLCGELLRERAELTYDADDATAAVRLLRRAVDDSPDRPVAAERWLELGRAHRTQWTVGRVEGSAEAAHECLVRALAEGADIADQVRGELVALAELLHDRGTAALAAGGTGRVAGLADLARAVRIALHVLESAPVGTESQAALSLLVPVLAGWVEFTYPGERPAELDSLASELAAALPAGTVPSALDAVPGDTARLAEELWRLAAVPPDEPALHAYLTALAERDVAGMDAALAGLREAPDEVGWRVTLGAALCVRGLVAPADGAARDAVAALEEAVRLIEPDRPLWTVARRWLARAYRTRDDAQARDRARGRALGLESPYGPALEVAGWCIADRDAVGAARALELSRGPLAPSLRELRAALTGSGAQALVYLVPPDDDCAPAAVVVPAAGAPRIVPLPAIGVLPAPAIAARPGEHATRALRETVEWAWRVAMRPVVECCQSMELHRPYRLVLVPLGQLGAVPWHAARTPSGRYLVQDAVVSYAASAAQFATAAAREPVPVDEPGLVVADPAVHEWCHPEARYLPDPKHLGGWLGTTREAPAGVVHLGTALDAGTIAPDGGYRVGTVFLAAPTPCTGRGYDEESSPASVLLRAGARTVVRAHGSVPDPLLTYLFHRYLTEDRLRPAYALRLAQLWLLDPDRRIPAELPTELRDRAAQLDPRDLSGWAGVSHLGQW